jgi:hypothetical protein
MRTRLNSSTNNLRFGSLGNGVTVYDVTRQNPNDKHDYLTVAHIDDTGMIRYNAEVSEDERKAINDYAIKQQKKWLDSWESKNALTRLQILQDKADTATLLAMSDDRKSGKVGIIGDVLDKYTAPVFFDSLVKYGYEYPDNPSFNSSRRINSNRRSLKTRMAVRHSINSARRRAAMKANRLNCGYYYDGEDYSEMGYDKEQDAYYDLPDEMWIYTPQMSSLKEYVRDGVTTGQEISEWFDYLCEAYGGVLAWDNMGTRFYPVKKYSIQDLSKDDYDVWTAEYPKELEKFKKELDNRYE